MTAVPPEPTPTPDVIAAALREIEGQAERQRSAILRFAAALGDRPLSECSVHASGSSRIQILSRNYLTTLRALRPLASGPAVQDNIFPEQDSNAASVWFHLEIADLDVQVCGKVADYTRLLKPGATCQRVSAYDKVVCA